MGAQIRTVVLLTHSTMEQPCATRLRKSPRDGFIVGEPQLIRIET